MKLTLSIVLLCYAWSAWMILISLCRAAARGDRLMRAACRKNRAVTSAPPARPTSLASRNAPGRRASLLTVNPKSILN